MLNETRSPEKGDLRQMIADRDNEIALLKAQLIERTEELHRAYLRLNAFEQSASWRLVLRLRGILQFLFPVENRWSEWNRLVRRGIHIWLDHGFKELVIRAWLKFKMTRGAMVRRGTTGFAPNFTSARLDPSRTRTLSGKSGKSDSAERIYLFCDTPDLSKIPTLSGSASLEGWAVAESGVEWIEIHVDKELMGQANYRILRGDIGKIYTDMVDAEHSGFRFVLDTHQIPDGQHQLALQVTTQKGNTVEFTAGIRVDNTTPRKDRYHSWIEINETKDILEAHQRARELEYQPLLSIVMPVYNTDTRFLKEAIDSVRAQAYKNWELCICNDGSTNPDVRPLLDLAASTDSRVQVNHLEKNSGITAASNGALALATGEFITLMDSDDVLPPHAFYEVVKLLNAHPDADFVYSDEDKADQYGKRYEPFFKPDWSPDLFLSCNYIAHLTTIRASLVKEIGGFHPGYEGSQDYDLYLRAIEKTEKIFHIPKILYHWRSISSSTASDPYVRMTAHTAAKKAIEDHVQREKIDACVTEGYSIGRWRIKYALKEQPAVSLIIPTGGKLQLLKQCLEGVAAKTSYRNYEIVIVDNSRENTVEQFFPTVARVFEKSRYIDFRNRPFNYSLLNNQAVKLTDSPLVLFLNDDIVPINEDWLEAMVEHALRKEVGAVGAKLIFPNNTIQHAGVLMGLFANSGHAFKYMPADERAHGYFDLAHIIRNSSAVTAACMLTQRDVFWQVGGFEEIHLAVAFQDVDLCLKLREKGYLIVYTPHAKLMHYEAKTKAEKVPHPYEVRYMQRKWAHVIAHDPYYNPNLTREREDFTLAVQ